MRKSQDVGTRVALSAEVQIPKTINMQFVDHVWKKEKKADGTAKIGKIFFI